MKQKFLTTDDHTELDHLTAAVTRALADRREWLDVKMLECSDLQIGDDIYDLTSGEWLGVVTEVSRYHRDRDQGIRDTSIDHHFVYTKGDDPRGDNTYYNTSGGFRGDFGTKEQALDRAERRAAALR